MNFFLNVFCLITIFFGTCISSTAADGQEISTENNKKVVLASELNWEQLNPKRGDASPKAATIWGDRNGTDATGFLVKFVDGFSSPPHIHNVSYRGVVIEGLVHNDDPEAKPMWMPPGSFWTQPAGEVHITSAKGRQTVAYIEIEKGPYLVLPTEQAFDRGERPVNVDPSNIVWLDAANTNWIDQNSNFETAKAPQIAFLWGEPKGDRLNGTLIKLPDGFSGTINSKGAIKAVLIAGKAQLGESDAKTLAPGSYFSSTEMATHQISNDESEDCLIYVRSQGKIKVIAGS